MKRSGNWIERATGLRLAMVALGAFAAILYNQGSHEQRELLAFIAYLTIGTLLQIVASKYGHPALAYSTILLDIGAAAGIVLVTWGNPLPLWIIYLFPIAAALNSGRLPALLIGGLSVASYIFIAMLVEGKFGPDSLWVASAIAAAAVALSLSSSRLWTERVDRRAWQKLALTLRALPTTGTEDEVAGAVVRGARHLLRAEGAALWQSHDEDRMIAQASAGRELTAEMPIIEVSTGLRHRLRHGVVPLSDIGPALTTRTGLAILLKPSEETTSLLAVSWHERRGAKLSQQLLKAYARGAANALQSAKDRAVLCDDLRWARLLCEAATALAGTLETQRARRIVVGAARAGFCAPAALIDKASGMVISGDLEVSTAATGSGAVDEHGQAPDRGNRDALLVATIDDAVCLAVSRSDLGDFSARRFEQLALLAKDAFLRCTEHTRMLEAVQKLHAAIDGAPAPIALWTVEGGLLFANTAHRELDFGNQLTSDVPAAGHERELTVGEPPRTFVADSATILNGKYLVEAYREITREREALRAKDELISVVGHELRSPLTTIYGYSQMMSRQLGVVQSQVAQLNHLIGDFVDAARTESGQLPLNRQALNVAEIALAAAERFRGAYQDRQLRVCIEDVPPIEGDRGRLDQVLDNLLGNAAKYSTPDGEISLAISKVSGQVMITVRDHGVGIAAEHLLHVFDRLYRVPGAETSGVKGLGLGLSIVRDLVAAHGGRVWAESEGLGSGSTFRVCLPTNEPADLAG